MRKTICLSLAVVSFIAFGVLAWWWLALRTVAYRQAIPIATPIAQTQVTAIAKPPPKPEKFARFSSNLPTNSEEKAMLDWWLYMDKHDPQFQWKTPLSFYGRVVDQHSQPVANARVWLAWNDTKGSQEMKTESREDGRFELTDKMGKALSVQVGKDGYKGFHSSNQGFEFSEFWNPTYYVADKHNPVLFRLWKLEDAEPLYFWNKLKKLAVDGQKVWFDTKTGTFGASGDVAFSTRRGMTYALRQFDWSLTIEAAPGAGIALRNDELMFEAPEGVYQQSWTEDIGGKGESYTISKTVKFYLKCADGKYAAMQAEVAHMTVPEAEVNVSAYVNPSGSRNLQYDAKKRLTPKP